MPEKLDKCIEDVKAQGEIDNPYAVCNASIKETNENRQVPFFNPQVKVGKVEPDIEKTPKNVGGDKLDINSMMWKSILDSQLKQNVKEPKL